MSSVTQASPTDFPHREDLNKNLEFIQAIISRQANNSFLLKGWSVTLVAALFALAAKDANVRFVWVALVPVFIFGGLDAYYLHQEKRFRSLFNFVRKASSVEIDRMGPFCLNPDEVPHHEKRFAVNAWQALSSPAIWLFYLALLAAVLSVARLTSSSSPTPQSTWGQLIGSASAGSTRKSRQNNLH